MTRLCLLVRIIHLDFILPHVLHTKHIYYNTCTVHNMCMYIYSMYMYKYTKQTGAKFTTLHKKLAIVTNLNLIVKQAELFL